MVLTHQVLIFKTNIKSAYDLNYGREKVANGIETETEIQIFMIDSDAAGT